LIGEIAGMAPQQPAAALRKTELGQADFLALMVAQLKNQDPTKPVDNAEYVSQLAQFSQISGLAEIGVKLDALLAATIAKD